MQSAGTLLELPSISWLTQIVASLKMARWHKMGPAITPVPDPVSDTPPPGVLAPSLAGRAAPRLELGLSACHFGAIASASITVWSDLGHSDRWQT